MIKHKFRFWLPVLVLLISTTLAACISTSSEPEIVATRVLQEQVAPNPPAQFDLTMGAAIYGESCAPCHGESGGGDGPSASAFSCEMPRFADGAPDQTLTDWYNVAFNGRRSGDTCIMPPWSRQLATDDIWAAVAFAGRLRYDQSLAQRGQSVLDEHQTGEVAFLADTFWQAGSSDADILAALQANTLPGFDFSPGLSDEERQAALVAIRSAAFPQVTAVTPVPVAPEPASTEEASEDVFLPDASELLPPADAPLPEQITVTGNVVNGTAGAQVPQGLIVTLRVVGLNETSQPIERYSTETAIDAENTFSFAGVPVDPRAILSLETQYSGVRQIAPEIFVADISGESFDTNFTIYETTNDPDVISLLYMESLVDAVNAEGASLVFQTFEFTNDGDRIFANADGTSVEIPLPTGAVNASADAFAAPPDRFVLDTDGGQTRFIDTQPVFPGRVHRVDTRYNLPYNGRMQIEQSFPYLVAEFAVFVPQHRGLQVESTGLSPIESGELNGITYLGYGGGGLSPNTFFVFTVSDSVTAGESDRGSLVGNNGTLILGIGVLILIAGGMFMLYDLQRTRLMARASGSALSREDLLAEIAALDEAYEVGRIDEDDYEAVRAALKERLRRFVK